MKIVRYISKVKDMKKNTRTISQQNAHRKAYEEKFKSKAKDVPTDGNIGKYGYVTYLTNLGLLRVCFWNCNGYPWNMGFGIHQ